MRSRSLVRFVALLAVLALALPVLARPVSKTINLAQTAKFGSSQVSAGEYRLLIDGTKVTVERNGKTVAQVAARWEQRDAKSQYNSVLIGPNGDVQEVRFAGDSRVLVISAE